MDAQLQVTLPDSVLEKRIKRALGKGSEALLECRIQAQERIAEEIRRLKNLDEIQNEFTQCERALGIV